MSEGNELAADRAGGTPLYVAVHTLLHAMIRQKDLPEGTLLKEGSLASSLGMSRAPVRRALGLLSSQGLIREAAGQGFLVGKRISAGRLNALQLRRMLSSRQDKEVDRSAAWERIYLDMSAAVTACLPFGTYRINEADVGRHFAVSRTVVREALVHLMNQRLIEKDRRSHWIAGPLTARDIREAYEMRRILEPHLLAQAAPHLDLNALSDMRARVNWLESNFDRATIEKMEKIEDDLHCNLFSDVSNRRMLSALAQNRLPIIVPKLFRRHFGLKSDFVNLTEHGLILDQLLKGSVDVACAALTAHLVRSEKATMQKLRVLSVLPKPASAPYLINIH